MCVSGKASPQRDAAQPEPEPEPEPGSVNDAPTSPVPGFTGGLQSSAEQKAELVAAGPSSSGVYLQRTQSADPSGSAEEQQSCAATLHIAAGSSKDFPVTVGEYGGNATNNPIII